MRQDATVPERIAYLVELRRRNLYTRRALVRALVMDYAIDEAVARRCVDDLIEGGALDMRLDGEATHRRKTKRIFRGHVTIEVALRAVAAARAPARASAHVPARVHDEGAALPPDAPPARPEAAPEHDDDPARAALRASGRAILREPPAPRPMPSEGGMPGDEYDRIQVRRARAPRPRGPWHGTAAHVDPRLPRSLGGQRPG